MFFHLGREVIVEYRKLGKTGIVLSEIGFGSWAIGGTDWGQVEDGTSVAAMERAIELGVNFIDTADVYGDGRSEEQVAKILKGRRDKLVVASKGGLLGHHRDPKREPFYDSAEKVIAAFDASLRRLETDFIDLYFCHIWWDKHEETEAFLQAFEILKRDGKVRAVGVSTDSLDYVKHFNRDGGIDMVQFDMSILRRNAENGLLDYLTEHQLGGVVRGPLRMGLLTDKFNRETTFPEKDVRFSWPGEDWFKESFPKIDRLRDLTAPDQSMGQLALRWVLTHPAVTSAIPGAKTPAQAEQNIAASRRPLLSNEHLRLVDEISPRPAVTA